jgi:hypothetical protein
VRLSTADFDPPQAAHGFFHTLVVMGSALALGCGGISHDHPPNNVPVGGSGGSGDGEHGGGGAATDGGGGRAASTGGGSTGTGGAVTSGAGSGNIIVLPSGAGGAPSGLDAGAAGELACPPEQWLCAMTLGCSGSNLPSAADCSCDDSLPLSPEACGADESFVCRGATNDTRGYPLPRPERYECTCVAAATECQTTCNLAFGQQARCLEGGQQIPTDTILCDCAMIVLR